MAIRYSKYFDVNPRIFEEMGVFNGFVDQDSKFHVDPLLMRGSSIPEFQNAYDFFLDYFRGFVPLVRHIRQPDMTDMFFRRMVERFTFPELQYTGLGFSEGHSRGTGISGKLSRQLANSAYEIINAGFEDPEIFALMPLIEENIGQDRISDMTIAILRKQFLAYTQRISTEMGIKTIHYKLSYDEYYDVPLIGTDTIHFIPRSFLNDLFIATSIEEVADAANYNERLKVKLTELIGATWDDSVRFSKADWKRVIFNNRECYEAAIEYYKSIKGVSYNFDVDRHGKYLDLKVAKIVEDFPLQFLSGIFKSKEDKVFGWTTEIIGKFKQLIEANRMSELVYRHKRIPDETDWQLILFMVATAYVDGARISLDITRENNPGNGEVDFKFSSGTAKTIVEIKRSGNPDLLHGYRIQLPAYMLAEQTDYGLFVVIIDNPSQEETVKEQFDQVIEDMRIKGERVCPIIFVRGYHQSTASKPTYFLYDNKMNN